MKKLSTLFIIATACISFTACKKDFLDQQPQASVSRDDYWKTQADAVNAVNNCYRQLGDVDNRMFISGATDDSYAWSNWPSEVLYVGNGSATPDNNVFGNFWRNLYRMIASCNDVLDNVDRVPNLADSLRTRLRGEARFVRAYAYQQLIGMYGDVPLITHIQSIDEFKVSRTPRAEVATFIAAEMDTVSNMLPASYGSSDFGRATKGAALALKARTMLYEGKWQEAATAAKAVIDANYFIIDPNYRSLFDGTNKQSKELIFVAQYVKNTLPNATATWMGGPSIGGWSELTPTQALVDAFEATDGKPITQSTVYDPSQPFKNRDPRLGYVVILPGDVVNNIPIKYTDTTSIDCISKNNASFTGYYYKKYIPSDIAGDWDRNSSNDIVLIRFAEVLLTYAEAKIELNQIDQSVYDAINRVRQRPGVMMPQVTAATAPTQTALRDAVRRERRAEFAVEDNRLFDIRRWKIAETVMNGPVYGILNNFFKSRNDYGKHILVETRVFKPGRDYLWAIPQSERSINPNIGQNSGW
ncbi:RagB/SusD family nutrient uptake outer membrane protein [Chitinophaga agrisoli]|uniref:RagB/SusD family nutrient uptake outer membrane protein n=1 Tax=Chitinophaga agrisoli TaxID=2607653 RepID=A0A5B2VUN0_9BACT|nr:RagB/SusD family nutrient uptake outer membrane protein [Chitinophaga agrisoli]KAA2241779.1 RagB/SusD family nutrient uptake outer membrane protein [Chitinophaga agrisoli]